MISARPLKDPATRTSAQGSSESPLVYRPKTAVPPPAQRVARSGHPVTPPPPERVDGFLLLLYALLAIGFLVVAGLVYIIFAAS